MVLIEIIGQTFIALIGFNDSFFQREEMFRLVESNKAVNLGVGMPDFSIQPQSLMDAMVDITVNGGHAVNQYTRGSVLTN